MPCGRVYTSCGQLFTCALRSLAVSELLPTALALGLAGIDPAGALLGLGALSAGARPRHVVAFAVVAVLGTALLGTVLALTVGEELRGLRLGDLLPPDGVVAVLEALLAAALVWWVVARLRRSGTRPPRPATSKARTGAAALVGLGVVFAASAVVDPTFVGLVLVAGRQDDVGVVAVAQLGWILVSQAPLAFLAVAVALGRHQGLVALGRRAADRLRPVASRLVTAVLALAAAGLALDAAWWCATGDPLLA